MFNIDLLTKLLFYFFSNLIVLCCIVSNSFKNGTNPREKWDSGEIVFWHHSKTAQLVESGAPPWRRDGRLQMPVAAAADAVVGACCFQSCLLHNSLGYLLLQDLWCRLDDEYAKNEQKPFPLQANALLALNNLPSLS